MGCIVAAGLAGAKVAMIACGQQFRWHESARYASVCCTLVPRGRASSEEEKRVNWREGRNRDRVHGSTIEILRTPLGALASNQYLRGRGVAEPNLRRWCSERGGGAGAARARRDFLDATARDDADFVGV